MFNRILVPLDLSDYAEAATRRACEIANAHRSQVTGMVVINMLNRIRANHDQAGSQERRALETRMELALGKFCETCDNAHVPFIGDNAEGLPISYLFETALYYDLAVVGLRTSFLSSASDQEDLQPIGKHLDRTSTPVLAVPKGEQKPFSNALVAFDGSVHAARTLREFLDFQRPFDMRVTVITQDEDAERAESVNKRALARIRSAGIRAPEGIIVTNRELIDVYKEDHRGKFDLVVAGIHTKRLIKDFVVGSFANSLIEDGSTALFLGQ